MSIDPFPDELLSSWFHRLALANGIAPRSFAGVLGLGGGMWSARLDLRLPHHVAALLGAYTDVPLGAMSTMAMTGWALTPLLLPLRENARRNRSTWLQYCPLCLGEDEAPYFRRQWRLASRVSCFVHGCGLRDRCPACRGGIAIFDQTELIPQHFCARCGFDLCRAPKASVKAAARRLERAIDDICRLEVAKGSPPINGLVSRLLRAPVVADVTSAKTLTNLSTSARIRCFESLAAKPDDWLAADEDTTITHRRRLILAAGGHDRLIARFTDLLEKQQDSLRPKRSSPPSTDLPALLTAYARIMTGTHHFVR
ncbi:TniQ family protein [Mesorhizobium sp. M0114]|uniref:TniQ family protein n=1 Tax=unclassified Mesorhizobium TaxID=325217 RepID=UPI00333D6599